LTKRRGAGVLLNWILILIVIASQFKVSYKGITLLAMTDQFGVLLKNFFFFVSDGGQYKLECLSMAGHSSRV